MNKQIAEQLLKEKLSEFELMQYSALKEMIGKETVTGELYDEVGKWYQYEILVFWDHKKGGNIRVIGSIDDGLRVFAPLTIDFIKYADD